MAEATLGAPAKAAPSTDAATAATARTLKISDALRSKARLVKWAPMTMPSSSTSWTGTLASARLRSVSPNVCSYWSEASEAKPTIDAARNGSAAKIRRKLAMVHTMRTASA